MDLLSVGSFDLTLKTEVIGIKMNFKNKYRFLMLGLDLVSLSLFFLPRYTILNNLTATIAILSIPLTFIFLGGFVLSFLKGFWHSDYKNDTHFNEKFSEQEVGYVFPTFCPK